MPRRKWVSGSQPMLVIHPALLAIAWVLNQGLLTEAQIPSMARPVLVAASVAVLLTLFGWLVLRNRWDAGLMASVVILLVILPFPLLRIGQALGPPLGILVLTVSLTAVVGIPLVLALRARKLGRPIPRPSPGRLNAFSIVLLLAVIVTNTLGDAGTAIARMTMAPEAVDPIDAPAPPPDIVLLLLDGYPRADVLQRRLGIDNTAFVDQLADRGFDVADDSNSNYVFTALTLASMFQMRYVDDIAEVDQELGTGSEGHDLLRHAALGGRSWQILRSAGYQIVTGPPGWEHVRLADVSDRVINDGQITEFERSLLESTWLLDVVDAVAPTAITESMRARLLNAFDALDAFATEPRSAPTFLFLHVPAPHPPLLVDADGDLLPVGPRSLSGNSPQAMGLSPEQYAARWQGEIAYVNRRVIQAVEKLQAADPEAVIVVMADHGYVQEVHADDPQARFANLFAAYTPDSPGLLADPPTPVNLLPRLLNHYLGTNLAIQPDRFFLSPEPSKPLLLTERTSPAVAGPGLD